MVMLLAVPAVAVADVKAPLCVPPDATPAVLAVGGTALVCWGTTGDCVRVRDRKVVRYPKAITSTPALRWTARKRLQKRTLLACSGSSCKSVGARLAAELDSHPDWAVQVTHDLATATITDPDTATHTLWSIVKDRSITIAPPSEYDRTKATAPPINVGADVVGNTIVTSWTDCAGPCSMSVLVDPETGKNRGAWFPTGHAAELDPRRIAVIGNEADGKLTVIDTQTAVQTVITLATGPIGESAIVRLSDDRIGVLWSEGAMSYAAHVKLGATPSIVDRQAFERCP